MNNQYYKKYLKYKTKYLELLQQSGGNPNPLPISPWYNLNDHTLFCTSDLEGGAPFNNLRESGLIASQVTNKIRKALQIDRDGLIFDLNENTAFSFLGDLLDNNKYSIRLLQNMIKLKEKYPKRVILLGGNRDFNKIRMGIELFIHAKDYSKSLPWAETKNIQQLLERLSKVEFEFRHVGIPDYLKDVLQAWDDSIKSGALDIYNDSDKIKERINVMYKNTLGIGNLTKFMKEELSELFSIDLSSYSDDVIAKLICTIHMVMAFDWKCNNKLPSYLYQFNGLYPKYLSVCHVIAGFTLNGKNGILSHGSLPIKTTIDRKLTYPFGYDHKTLSNSSSLTTIMYMIESEKIELIKEYNNLMNSTYIYSNFPMVTKFVHLTALTNDPKMTMANSTYSPVVWSQQEEINTLPDIKVKLSGLRGGAPGYDNWVTNDSKKSRLVLEDGSDIINYNIFGHSPSYFNPIYHRKDHTLHINLDVSKIEAQSNSNSFAFLIINKNKDTLIGRSKFAKIDNRLKDGKTQYVSGTGYDTDEIRTELSNHDHYYYHEINGGPVNLLKSDNILGLKYKVTMMPGFNKLIN